MKTKLESKEYELEKIPVGIGGKKIELFSVKRWEAIENNPYATEEEYIQNFPLWIKVWEASIVLSEHLAGLNIDKEMNILELGVGMGLTGLVLGAMGYNVTITDFNEDALKLLQKNIDHNGLETVQKKKLDWYAPDLERKYDIICGSELVCKENAMEPIVDLLHKYLKPEGFVYLAHDIRRNTMIKFVEKVKENFDTKIMIKTLKGKEEPIRISILILKHEFIK